MNVLVTGGSGFIGTHLVADLLKAGHSVSIYDTIQSRSHPHLCIRGDIRDKEGLVKALQGIDAVHHLAAAHRDDVRPASLYYKINVGGARNLVYAAQKNDVKKIIYTSTVAIYGLNSGKPHEESPIKPFNDYSKSKYQAELVFDNWVKGDDSRSLVIVRPVVIFGEGNRGNVYELFNQIASGWFFMVGNGRNEKSMAYVRNLSGFLTKCLASKAGRHVYNYADKPDMSLEELIEIACKALGKKPKIGWQVPYPIGLLGGYLFDVLGRIRGKPYPVSSIRIKKFVSNTKVSTERVRETGFIPPYSLIEGLHRMIESDFVKDSRSKMQEAGGKSRRQELGDRS